MTERDDTVDHPFFEIVWSASRVVDAGWIFFQKFTCANCGQRLTIDSPNRLYTKGSCDKCGHVTNIELRGCNYMIIKSLNPETLAGIVEGKGGKEESNSS